MDFDVKKDETSFAIQTAGSRVPGLQGSSVAVPFRFLGSAKNNAPLPDQEVETQQSLGNNAKKKYVKKPEELKFAHFQHGMRCSSEQLTEPLMGIGATG